jgi:prephenate dehydrogenase
LTVQIAILGLGQIGSSIGLALASAKGQVFRIGHDRDQDIARAALKAGTVDKITLSLPDAVENSDVVIVAVPVEDTRMVLETVAPFLKPGAVLLDVSPMKNQVTQWAKELITAEDRYFITLTPAINPKYLLETDAAHADLFHDSVIMLTTDSSVDVSAVTLTENLITLLGATPIFSDPLEIDGFLTSSHLLPELVAAALVNTATSQPGWIDGRKIASQHFARVTAPLSSFGDGEKLGQAALYNRENSVRLLDTLIEELTSLRSALAENNADALNERLDTARREHQTWWRQRTTSEWDADTEKKSLKPSFTESLGRLIGIRPKTKSKK